MIGHVYFSDGPYPGEVYTPEQAFALAEANYALAIEEAERARHRPTIWVNTTTTRVFGGSYRVFRPVGDGVVEVTGVDRPLGARECDAWLERSTYILKPMAGERLGRG